MPPRRSRDWSRCAPGPVFLAASLVAVLAGCGGDVYFCSDTDPAPPNCEICNNDRDDDLDGDVDCDDSNCRDAGVCENRRQAVTTSTIDDDPGADLAPGTTLAREEP